MVELRGSNKLTYVYEANGQRLAMTYNGAKYFYIYNAQGDVVELFDASARSVAKYTYDAWGNPVSITDGNGNDVSGNPNHIASINPFRYRGYYYDAETGFYYLQSRYYDPVTGRFLNADGQFNDGLISINLFVYCHNSPVNLYDPSGRAAQSLEELFNEIKTDLLNGNKSYSITDLLQVKKLILEIDKATSSGSIALSTGLGGLENVLESQTSLRLKSNGYFEKIFKYGKALKGVRITGYIVDGGLLAWDLHNIWSNDNYSTEQKVMGTTIAAGGVAAGIGVGWLAVSAANFWNPVGWGMAAAAATFVGINVLGGVLINAGQNYLYNKIGLG